MRLRSLSLLALVLAATGAAAAPKPAAHKPAPAAGKPPVVESAGPFDARDAANFSSLLGTLGAKAEVASRDKSGVLLKVTSPAGGFTAQFDGCNQQGRNCQAVQLDAQAEARTASI